MSVDEERSIRMRLGYSPWSCLICRARFFTLQDAQLHFEAGLSRHPESPLPQFMELIDRAKELAVQAELRELRIQSATPYSPNPISGRLGIGTGTLATHMETLLSTHNESSKKDSPDVDANACQDTLALLDDWNAGELKNEEGDSTNGSGEEILTKVPHGRVKELEETQFRANEPLHPNYADDCDETITAVPPMMSWSAVGKTDYGTTEEMPRKRMKSPNNSRGNMSKVPTDSRLMPKPTIPCRVCGDNSSGTNYGVKTCDGCRYFYKAAHSNYKCKREMACNVAGINRFGCKYCRYMKCLAVGMHRKKEVFQEPNVSPINSYPCTRTCRLCSRRLVLQCKSSAQKHVASIHFTEAAFACALCPYGTKTWDDKGRIRKHVSAAHPGATGFRDRRKEMKGQMTELLKTCFGIGVDPT